MNEEQYKRAGEIRRELTELRASVEMINEISAVPAENRYWLYVTIPYYALGQQDIIALKSKALFNLFKKIYELDEEYANL